jgi:hypothetical protein
MTDHDDARHDPEPFDGPAVEPELDDTALAALRALLRDEPVDDDDLARERRIRTALDAATLPSATAPVGPAPASESAPAPGVVPTPRRPNSSGPWLVAAAVLLVLGVGGYLFVGLTGSGDNDEAAVTADRATGSTSTAAGDANSGTDGAESSAIAGSGPVVDLGDFEDLPTLLAAADRSEARSDAAAEPTLPVGGVDPTPCVEEQRAAGLPVVATATLQGTVVVVVADPAGTRVLVAESCIDWPG